MANRYEDLYNAIYDTAGRSVRDYFHEVSEGHIPNHSGIYQFGINNNLSNGVVETLWGGSGTYVPPTGASRINIKSTSTADISNGIGARTIFIDGLDANYDIVRETIVLNGTVNVLTTNSFIAINQMLVDTAGSSGVNVGAISANQQSGNLLLNWINNTEGGSNSLLFTVPNRYDGHIIRIVCSSSKLTGGTAPKVTFTGKIYNPVKNTIRIFFEDIIDTDVQQCINLEQEFSHPIENKDTITVEVLADQNNTVAHGRIYWMLDSTGNIN